MTATEEYMIRDSGEAGFVLLQKEYEHQMLKRSRATLDPSKLYLDITSKLQQMFTALHIDESRTV